MIASKSNLFPVLFKLSMRLAVFNAFACGLFGQAKSIPVIQVTPRVAQQPVATPVTSAVESTVPSFKIAASKDKSPTDSANTEVDAAQVTIDPAQTFDNPATPEPDLDPVNDPQAVDATNGNLDRQTKLEPLKPNSIFVSSIETQLEIGPVKRQSDSSQQLPVTDSVEDVLLSLESPETTSLEKATSKQSGEKLPVAQSVRQAARETERVDDVTELPYVSPEARARLRLPQEIQVRARTMMEDGTSLAKRGAMHSARQEFLAVLQLVAQAYDAQLGVRYHTRALANGLRALQEADDFAAQGSDSSVDADLRTFTVGHKTPVLRGHSTEFITPFVAMQRYYEYAHEQLAIAGNNDPSAADALYAIGRVETMISRSGNGDATGPKPLALYQAALVVDHRNNAAANELGVLLARAGKYPEAHSVLAHAATVRPTKTLIGNLAKVDTLMRTGQPITNQQPMTNQVTPQMLAQRVPVQWVNPAIFSRPPGSPPLSPQSQIAGSLAPIPGGTPLGQHLWQDTNVARSGQPMYGAPPRTVR